MLFGACWYGLILLQVFLSITQVRRDGTKMSLAQSKKLSQLTADNAQWEDRQLLRSGAVRGTEVQTEFDDEEEHKVILLVHGKYSSAQLCILMMFAWYYSSFLTNYFSLLTTDTKPPFLDGRVVFTKQAEPIMPLKDPTSDMAIISRKGSTLVREIHEKQSMNKSRQRFWELAGSKLGDILGVEKTAEQVFFLESGVIVSFAFSVWFENFILYTFFVNARLMQTLLKWVKMVKLILRRKLSFHSI